ncbi:MAG: hypothetical protein JJ957_10975 [Pseudomonadales bacterium]|nr:hypothetical protein [Pseudomonadales bacterium]MBO6595979.1 hypothetical protein [Pseudomonadales bacterium]MBO6822462.1 hypothetical protein [Pseudomonadales bacterium]
MRRDFTRESYWNLFRRAAAAISGRLRGWLYLKMGVFSSAPGSRLIIGKGAEIKNGRNVYIQGKVKIGNFARIECHPLGEGCQPGSIILSDEVSLGNDVHIGAVSEITLDPGVLLGSNILLIDHSHGEPKADVFDFEELPKRRRLSSKGKIIIGRNVWICDGAVVLGGVAISQGVIIGANATVRSNVCEGTIYL